MKSNIADVIIPMWDMIRKFPVVLINDEKPWVGVSCYITDIDTLHKFLNVFRSPAHVWLVDITGTDIGNSILFTARPNPADNLKGTDLKVCVDYKICLLKSVCPPK